MLIVGVIDLIGGRAVHARAGQRDRYVSIAAVAGRRIEAGDAETLARIYRDDFGVDAIYVADLDAIRGGTPQRMAVARVAALGVPVWLDAGISRVEEALEAIEAGAARTIVGLETLLAETALVDICHAVGGQRVAFSLDLRDGRPIGADDVIRNRAAPAIAASAAAAGVAGIIAIDLARVGMDRGLDFDLLSRVRREVPGVPIVAGGGVRSVADVEALAAIGCDGVLIASALLSGRMSAADVAASRRLGRHDSDVR
jgi:phosphoribosylformimino-5-aminoimidazole carboxamide ribotide isomerase